MIISIISLIISVPLSALVLMFCAKKFKLQDTSFKTGFNIALILGVSTFVPDILVATILSFATVIIGILKVLLINIVLAITLIKEHYNIDIKKTLLIWLIWFLSRLIITIIVVIVNGLVIALFIPLHP